MDICVCAYDCICVCVYVRIKMRIYAYTRMFSSIYELAYCLSTVSRLLF